MKKLIFLVVLLCGCGSSDVKKLPERETQQVGEGIFHYPIRTFEYDGCEYIAVGNGDDLCVVHKGNCKYCQKRANHE